MNILLWGAICIIVIVVGISLLIRHKEDSKDGQPPDDMYPLW